MTSTCCRGATPTSSNLSAIADCTGAGLVLIHVSNAWGVPPDDADTGTGISLRYER
jgi:hypothetical protein